MTHRYLIGYTYGDTMARVGNGSIEITRPDPIRGTADIDDVMAFLRSHKGEPTLIVTSSSKFEEQS